MKITAEGIKILEQSKKELIGLLNYFRKAGQTIVLRRPLLRSQVRGATSRRLRRKSH